MKALVVTNMWPTADRPAYGIFVADQVAALRRSGADVDVFHFDGGSPFAYLKAALRLRKENRTEYDVVHAHFGLSAWVARAARAKVRAVTFHGTDLAHPRSRRISLAALRFIDLPAAASAELAAQVPKTNLKNPIQVLPCGVALDRFETADKMVARTELGLSANELVLLLPSDPSRPEKRSDRARQVADALGAKLITLGGVPPELVPVRINASDLVLIPSEREGFGLALLESLACETPVLTTPNGVAAEAVEGVAGAESLAWDESKWAEAGKRLASLGATSGGRASASRWSSDACAEAVLAAWTNALDSRS